ncbi:hypothetical protein PMIN06_001341 [Paraphaeosphaeria minitans]
MAGGREATMDEALHHQVAIWDGLQLLVCHHVSPCPAAVYRHMKLPHISRRTAAAEQTRTRGRRPTAAKPGVPAGLESLSMPTARGQQDGLVLMARSGLYSGIASTTYMYAMQSCSISRTPRDSLPSGCG